MKAMLIRGAVVFALLFVNILSSASAAATEAADSGLPSPDTRKPGATPSPSALSDRKNQIGFQDAPVPTKLSPSEADLVKDQLPAAPEEQKRNGLDTNSHTEQVLSRAAANDGLLNAAGTRVGEVGIAATAPVAPEIILDEESRPVEVEHEGEVDPSQQHRNNFASEAAGAVIMASNSEMTGVTALLGDDADSYALSRCDVKKYVIIGLSEDVLVDTLIVSNEEKYSSTIRQFRVLGAQKYPAAEWIVLGNFTAQSTLGEQLFPVTVRSWVRYLKINWLSHYGDEFYCTWTRVKVHGSTILEDLQQQVQSSEAEVHAARQQLQLEAALRAAGTTTPTLAPSPSPSAAVTTTATATASTPAAAPSVAPSVASTASAAPSTLDSTTPGNETAPAQAGNASTQVTDAQLAASDSPNATAAAAAGVSNASSALPSAHSTGSSVATGTALPSHTAVSGTGTATMGSAMEAVPSASSSIPSPSTSMPAISVHPTPAPPVPGMLGLGEGVAEGPAGEGQGSAQAARVMAEVTASAQTASSIADPAQNASMQPHTAEQAVSGMLDALDASAAREEGQGEATSTEQELAHLNALAAGLEAHASQLEISADAALHSIAAQAAGTPSPETVTVPPVPLPAAAQTGGAAPVPGTASPTATAEVTPVLVPVPPAPLPSPSAAVAGSVSPPSAVASPSPTTTSSGASEGAGKPLEQVDVKGDDKAGVAREGVNSSETMPPGSNATQASSPVEAGRDVSISESADPLNVSSVSAVHTPASLGNASLGTSNSTGATALSMLEAAVEASLTSEEALAAAAANLTLATISSSPVPKPLPDTSAPLLPQGQEAEAGEGSEDAEAQAVAALTAVNIPRLSADLASSKSSPSTQQTHTANVFKTLTRKIADLEIDNTLVHSYLTDMHGRYTAAVAALSRSTGAVRQNLAQVRDDIAGLTAQVQAAMGNGSFAQQASSGGQQAQGTGSSAVGSTGGSATSPLSSSPVKEAQDESDVSKSVAGLEKAVARVERALASITRVLIRHMRDGGIDVSVGDGGVLRRADEPVGWDEDSQAAGTALVAGGFPPQSRLATPPEAAALTVLAQPGTNVDGSQPPLCPACPGSDCEPAIPCLVPPVHGLGHAHAHGQGVPHAPGGVPPHAQHPEAIQAWYRQAWGYVIAWMRGAGMRHVSASSGASSASAGHAHGPQAWGPPAPDPVLTQQVNALQGEIEGLRAELSAATAAAQQALKMALWCTAGCVALAVSALSAVCLSRRSRSASSSPSLAPAANPVVDELIDITRHPVRRLTPASTPSRDRVASLSSLHRGGEGTPSPSAAGLHLTSPPKVGPSPRAVPGAASMPSPQPMPAGRGHMSNPALYPHEHVHGRAVVAGGGGGVPAPSVPKPSGSGGTRLTTPAAAQGQVQGMSHSGPGQSQDAGSSALRSGGGTATVSPSSISTASAPADQEPEAETGSEGSAPA